MCRSIYLTVYCLQFLKDVKLGIMTTNCLHVQKYCNGEYSSQICQSLALGRCLRIVGLSAYIFPSLCNELLLHYIYVITMKSDKFVARRVHCVV